MKKFLEIYVWMYIILCLLGIFVMLGEERLVFEILRNTLFWVFGPVCIFLYVYDKKWLPLIFWKVYFLLAITDIVYDFFYLKRFYRLSASISETIQIISYSMELLIVTPILIGMYLYAFKRSRE